MNSLSIRFPKVWKSLRSREGPKLDEVAYLPPVFFKSLSKAPIFYIYLISNQTVVIFYMASFKLLYNISIKFHRTSLALIPLSYPMNLFYHFITKFLDHVISYCLIHDCRFCILLSFLFGPVYSRCVFYQTIWRI